MRSRRDFLRMGGMALAGAAVLGSIPRVGLGSTPETAESLNIKPSNTAAQNRASIIAAMNNTSKHIVFGTNNGDYKLDNASVIQLNNFQGIMEFVAGTTSRLVFMNNQNKGLVFNGGTGAQLLKVRTKFNVLPPARVTAKECLHFVATTDTLIQNINVVGSAAAGILFGNSIRPRVINATINDSRADGLHFANCANASVTTLSVNRPGDDGLAFLDYGGQPNHGGVANDVTVTDGGTRGITVVGQRDVEIYDFLVNKTYTSGLYVCRELSYDTPSPENVSVHDGEVIGAGRFLKGGGSGPNPDSIFYNSVWVNVSFANIVSRCPVRSHVRVGGQGGTATLTNIQEFAAC